MKIGGKRVGGSWYLSGVAARLPRLALLLLIPLLLGGDRPVREILIHGRPFPNRVAILVDRSGSMAGKKHGMAVHEAMRVAEQAGDDGRVRFYAFEDDVLADPQGWIKLPDAEALALARGFLRHHGPAGSTNLVGAMQEVLALEEPDLGVVIVTDEEPDGGALPAADEIERLNAARQHPATIGVIGIFPSSAELGAAVATAAGGPYLRVVVPPPATATRGR